MVHPPRVVYGEVISEDIYSYIILYSMIPSTQGGDFASFFSRWGFLYAVVVRSCIRRRLEVDSEGRSFLVVVYLDCCSMRSLFELRPLSIFQLVNTCCLLLRTVSFFGSYGYPFDICIICAGLNKVPLSCNIVCCRKSLRPVLEGGGDGLRRKHIFHPAVG